MTTAIEYGLIGALTVIVGTGAVATFEPQWLEGPAAAHKTTQVEQQVPLASTPPITRKIVSKGASKTFASIDEAQLYCGHFGAPVAVGNRFKCGAMIDDPDVATAYPGRFASMEQAEGQCDDRDVIEYTMPGKPPTYDCGDAE
jgi:hypothetical protein